MMLVAALLQTFPITSQNVDKFLSLDLPSLIVVLAVVIGLTLLVNNYFTGRNQAASNNQQASVIKFFTDENSPMVTSNRRVADAIEKQTQALIGLGANTQENTKELTNQTTELKKQTTIIDNLSSSNEKFSMLVTADMSRQTERIAELTASINELNKKVDELIKDKVDCNGLREQLATFQTELFRKLAEQTKRDSKTMQAVIPEQTISIEAPKEIPAAPPLTN